MSARPVRPGWTGDSPKILRDLNLASSKIEKSKLMSLNFESVSSVVTGGGIPISPPWIVMEKKR